MSLSDAIEKKKQQKGAAGSIASSAPSVNMESRFDQAIQIKKAGGSISSMPKMTPVSTKPKAPGVDDNSLAYQMLKDRAESERMQQSLPISQRIQNAQASGGMSLSDYANLVKSFTGTPAQDAYNDYLKQRTDYSSYLKAADFEEYSKKGAEIQNPTFGDAQGKANILGWRPGAGEVGNIVTFSRDNLKEINERLASDDKSDFVGDALYGYMTEDEVGIYNYLLAKEGKEAAERYLESIRQDLNARYGKKVAEDVEKTRGTILHPVMVAGTATSAGLDQYAGGVKQASNEYELPTSAIQFAGQNVRAKQGTVGKLAYDAINMLSNMAPSILASYVAAGLGAPAAVAEWAAAGSLGLGSGGNAYKQALAEGRSKEEAQTVAALTGASEAVLSKLLSGIGAFGGLTPEKLLPKVAAIENAIWRVAAAGAVKIGGEEIEEIAQLYLEPLFKTLVYGDKYDAPAVEDVAYTALLTFLTTGLLEGGDVARYRTKEGAASAAGIEYTPKAVAQEASQSVSGEGSAPGGGKPENAPAAAETGKERAVPATESEPGDFVETVMRYNREQQAAAQVQQNEKTAAESQRSVSESNTDVKSDDTESMRVALAEQLDRGEITEAEYNERMESIEELESLDDYGSGSLDTYNPDMMRKVEVNTDGRSSISDDGSQRAESQSAGEQAGALAEGAGRYQSRQVQSQRAAGRRDDVSRYYESRGQQPVSARDYLGTGKVNKVSTVQEMPAEMVTNDAELNVIAEEIRDMGMTPHLYVGDARLRNGNSVDGLIRGKDVYIRVDGDVWTATQNWDHEKAHAILRQSPGIEARLYGEIVGRGEAARRKLHQTMQRYREAYHGIYDMDENGNEIWDDTVQEMILQEIIADAYAGKDTFAQGVEEYADVSSDAVSQIESQGGEVRGPPEGRLSMAGVNAKTADLDALSRAEEMERRGVDEDAWSAANKSSAKTSYDGKNLAEESDVYGYDFLTSLPDMTITMLPEVAAVCDDRNNVVPLKAVELGVNNARSVGTERAGKTYVENKYTGHELRVDVSSIRHGINGDRSRKLTNARLGAVIGDLVQNAVPINALYDAAENVDGTYAMAAYAVDSKNREFVSIITVEQQNGTVKKIQSYDVTHSVSGRAKRKGSQVDTKSQGVYPIKAATISIADLIENVNATYQSVLSDDVLAHLGETRSPQGYYSNRVKFSQEAGESSLSVKQHTVDAMPAKAQRVMESAERKLQNSLGKVLGNPAKIPEGVLEGIAREISNEFLETGTVSDETIDRTFEQAYSAVESEVEQQHGVDAEDYRQWAERDYIAEVAKHLAELRLVKRYAAEKAQQAARDEADTIMTLEELGKTYQDLKAARRGADKAVARNLLTESDERKVHALLRGDIDLDMLKPETDNVRGITEVYNAKLEYEKVARRIRRWNATRKGELRALADKLLESASDWTDKGAGWLYSRETMERNIRDIVPDKKVAQEVIDTLFKPVHDGAAAANKMKNEYRDRVRKLDLSRKVAKGNEISEAAAVQLLGEAEDNIRHLEQNRFLKERDGKSLEDWRGIVRDMWDQNPNLDAAKIRKAVKEFREIYDELFEQMNTVRMRNGYEPVNYRKGYFPHFQSKEGDGILGQFGKALGVNTAALQLPTTINGLTHTFKPGMQWFGSAQQRMGVNTAFDAVEGFDSYIEGVADVINQTDNIQRLRAFAAQVRYRTSEEGIRKQVDAIQNDPTIAPEDKQNRIEKLYAEGKFELGNLAVELDEYTNLLAGKKSRHDRDMEQKLGRRMYAIMKGLEGRVAANMVAINPGSWLTNFIPITQGAATLDTGSLLSGMWDTLKAYKQDDGFVGASSFLTNRRGSDPLVRTWTQKASAKMSSPMELIDSFTADTLVRARYNENVRRGLSEAEAMADADAWAAGVMADRSKGAMPTLFSQTNPLTKLLTQFQLEVNNQLSYVFKDMPREMREKGAMALAMALFKFVLGAYLYDEVYEYFIGRRPALDPLGIINDTVGDLTGYELPNLVELGVGAVKGEMPSFEVEKKDPYTAAESLMTATLEELPFIGSLMGGGRLPISSALPDWENLGKALLSDGWDPKKKWATMGKELAKPATYLALPFGGGQVKKIVEGGKAVIEGGSYNVNSAGEKILQYPVYNDTPGQAGINAVRAMLFGKSSLPTAQEWVESGFDSLGTKQTALYEDLKDAGATGEEAYQLIRDTEAADSNLDKIATIANSYLDEKMKLLAMSNAMSESQYAKYTSARAAGVSSADYAQLLRVIAKNAAERGSKSTSQADVKAALQASDLTNKQKRAIWDSYGWKTESPW